MKILKCAALCLALSACGGGGGGASNPALPAPTVAILSGTVARYVASNTGISFDVLAKPSFNVSALHATAADNDGLVSPNVAVAANGDGTFTLSLDSKPALPAGHYKGSLTLKLCSDTACQTPLAVPAVTVPYDITVMDHGTAWPGNNLTPLVPWTEVADWSTFRGNAAQTGSVAATLKPDTFTLRWKSGPLGADSFFLYGYFNTVVASKGILYATGDKSVKAIRESDGSVAWTHDFSSVVYWHMNPPAVANDTVYVSASGNVDSFMYGFDAATGAVRFKTPMTSQGQSHLAPVVDDGMVYTNGGTYGGLYAFKSTGEQVFTGQLPDVGMSALSLDAANVYAYVGDRLLTFDRKTGKQVGVIADASTKAYGNIDGAAVIGAAGEAFAANYGATVWSRTVPMNELLRFDLQKGTIGWRVAGNYPLGPAYQGGTLYAVNIVPYRLEARAASDGTARWTWTPPVPGETAWSSEPVVTNNMLFVSTDMATYAIDLRSHKTVWSYPAAGRLALTQSGILYIQNTDGIVAINVK